MKSTQADLSDVFNKKYLEKVFPKILNELLHNSVYDSILHELCPKGINANGNLVGTVAMSSVKQKEDYATYIASLDQISRITYSLLTVDDIKIAVSLNRAYMYVQPQSGLHHRGRLVTYQFTNEFSLNLVAHDTRMGKSITPMLRCPIRTASSSEVRYDSNDDFDSFVIGLVPSLKVYAAEPDPRVWYDGYKNQYIETRKLYTRF